MSSSTSNFSYHESLRNSIKQGDEESEPITALPQMNDSHELKLENSRRHRRLLDRFVLAPEVEDPKSYGRPFKWLVTSLVAAAATLDFMGATILYPALPELPTDLNTTANVANLAVALSFIGPAIMPLYWSFISEKYGRRIVSISSLALYVLFTALAASSSSISMLIVMRLLSSACSGNSVGPAVIADIWEVKERGHAMSIYYLGPLGGPTIAPVIGGILTQVWDWRATQWFQTVYAALILIFMSFALPETHRGPTLASGKRDVASPPSQPATKSSRKSPAGRAITRLLQLVLEFGIWLKRPLRVLTFTRFLLVNLSIYLSSISYGILIMTSVSTQQAFSIAPYEFNYLIIGLLFLPRSAGLILGTLISGKWSDRIMNLEAKRLGRYDEKGAIIYAPEDRIRENAWFFVALMPAALIWFGWTLDFGVLWIVPTIPTFLMGVSAGLIFSLVSTMMTEYIPHRSASMIALISLGRNVLATICGAITEPLISAIGNGWLYTGVSIIFIGNILILILIRKHGQRWREDIDEKIGLVRTKVKQEQVDPAPPALPPPVLPPPVLPPLVLQHPTNLYSGSESGS